MKIQFHARVATATVKIGVSRQVVIPKKFHDRLGLAPGDYLEVEADDQRLIFTPKALVDKRIAQGLEDIRRGRLYGPFRSVRQMLRSLDGAAKKARRRSSSSE